MAPRRPFPEPLTRVGDLSPTNHRFWAACAVCKRGETVEPLTLAGRVDPEMTIGELWIRGRFKCSGCGAPASHVMLYETIGYSKQVERWGVGVEGVADALRGAWKKGAGS